MMSGFPGTTTAAPTLASAVSPNFFKDVWTRSGSTYRARATVLLLINMLLFAGVGSFAFWLRTGDWFAPALVDYGDVFRETFLSVRVAGYSGISLGRLLLEPISVQEVPLQIPIVGLLMASLISIPILVSILYRFWASIPFILVVGVLAVMPWLSITLLGSCVIASVRPFRTRIRFMSAMLGLVPVVVYLILAWSGTSEDVIGRIDPIDRIKFVAPWVLAVVATALLFAVVLSIAKVVDYRPGAIAPLLAVMFVLPVALFENYVGRDELYYRRLEQTAGEYFADFDSSAPFEQAVADDWSNRSMTSANRRAIRENREAQWLLGLAADISPSESVLAQVQGDIVAHCDWFLRHYPDSRYAANALFIKARALDTRVDSFEFRRTKWIRYYDDYPSDASAATWEIILANRPNSKLGAVAMLRLAEIEARNCKVDQAISRLKNLIRSFDQLVNAKPSSPSEEPSLEQVMARELPESTLQISLEGILLEAHRLHDLLRFNQRDPLWGDEPLCGAHRADDGLRYGMLDLVPRHSLYVRNLQKLKTRYPHCLAADNIDLEIAKATLDPVEKIRRLQQILRDDPDGDALPQALFHLALTYQEQGMTEQATQPIERLTRQFPDSFWTLQVLRSTRGAELLQFTKADHER